MAEYGPVSFAKKVFSEFGRDDCAILAASLSYYAVFSLPPLLFCVLSLAGFIFGRQTVEDYVIGQAMQIIGPAAAEQIRTMLESAGDRASGAGIALVISIAALLFAATGLFVQLQTALNRAWQVLPDPERSGISTFLSKRLLSFAVMLGLVFLLVASLVISAIITAVGDRITNILPGSLSQEVLYVLNTVVSLILLTLIFAVIFRWMPDARVQWRDVWVGAGVTALLLILGKTLIGIYLGHSDTGETYGPAGALAVIMLWVYYTSLILLLGAEFTQVWAHRYGKSITPETGAVRVYREVRYDRTA